MVSKRKNLIEAVQKDLFCSTDFSPIDVPISRYSPYGATKWGFVFYCYQYETPKGVKK
jgi:hypothetical protein